MNANLKMPIKQITGALEFSTQDEYGHGTKREIIHEIKRLVIVERVSINVMPEWEDIQSEAFLVAITDSGKQFALMEVELND